MNNPILCLKPYQVVQYYGIPPRSLYAIVGRLARGYLAVTPFTEGEPWPIHKALEHLMANDPIGLEDAIFRRLAECP